MDITSFTYCSIMGYSKILWLKPQSCYYFHKFIGQEFGDILTVQFCSTQHRQEYLHNIQFSLSCCTLFNKVSLAYLLFWKDHLQGCGQLSLLPSSRCLRVLPNVLSPRDSHSLYKTVQSLKGRKQKMPILLKARPIIGTVSFSLYSINKSHRLTDFKGRGQRFHHSMERELMNLQPIFTCHKHNSSHLILFFNLPCPPFYIFYLRQKDNIKYLCIYIGNGL